MTISLNMIFQMIGVVIQALNQITPFSRPSPRRQSRLSLPCCRLSSLSRISRTPMGFSETCLSVLTGMAGFPDAVSNLDHVPDSALHGEGAGSARRYLSGRRDQNSTPQVGGGIRYLHRLTDSGMYNVEFLDVYSKTLQPFTVAFYLCRELRKRHL